MTRLLLLLILTLIGLGEPCRADTVKQTQGPATLEVHCDGDGRTLGLADQLTVTLAIEGSPALVVHGAPLDLGGKAKWLLVERSRDTKRLIGPNRVRWQLVYGFAPREPGREIAFAFPEVKFRDGDEQAVTWEPITFNVESQITAPDPKNLKGIPAIEELPPTVPPFPSFWEWWLVIGWNVLVLLFAITMGLWLFLRRSRSRSASDLARYELQRLVGMQLPEKGNSERFITLLTMLVRRYLERQYALPARRQTTPEFLRVLETSTTLTAQEKQFLSAFLQRSEAVKFAKAEMSVAECNEWAAATRRFLQAQG